MTGRKTIFCVTTFLLAVLSAHARSVVYSNQVKTLQVIVNQEWLSLPVMMLGQGDVLNVSFDELSHDYHRYIYRLEHCEADWSPSEGLFESNWLRGSKAKASTVSRSELTITSCPVLPFKQRR